MRNHLNFFILFLSFTLFIGCSSDDGGVVVSIDSDSFIQADVDGTTIKSDFSVLLQDREFNGYFVGEQRVKMQRYVEANDNRGFFIQLERVDLKNMVYPFDINYSTDLDSSSIQFVYYNVNNLPFVNNQIDNGDFNLTLNSYNNNKLVGEFSGYVYSFDPNDSTQVISKNIENGSFSVLLSEF